MPDQLPAPLTPPDCNLQNFKFMPVDVQRVLKSDTWRLASDSEKAAMTALWYESWHEVPAASLPNNERVLAHASGVKAPWAKVREQAMRGWRLCSDGRLYHPVVAEKALEAWIEKLLAQATGGAGNAKRWGVEFDAAAALAKLQDAARRLQQLAPGSDTLKKKAVVQALAGIAPGSAPDPKDASGGASGADSGRGRNRQGEGQGQGSRKTPPGAPPPPPAGTPAAAAAPTPPAAPRASKKCPPGFEVTRAMVEWAGREYPNVGEDPEALRRETQAFRDHTFSTARSDWPGTWRNWIKKASEDLARRSRASVPHRTEQRRDTVARHFPAVAESRRPPPRETIEGDVHDVTARPAIQG